MPVLAQGQVSFFTQAPTYPAGTGNAHAADFNLDGNQDLIYDDGTLLLGKGNGTFTAKNVTLPPSFISAVADFNNDGKPDLLFGVSTAPGFNLTVLLGNGDGTFQAPVNSFIGFGANYNSLVVADVNGDGKLDVMGVGGAGTSQSLTVFLGKGDGTFTIGTSIVVGSGGIVAGDFSGDHKVDVALISGSTIKAFLGNGDGTFKSPVTTIGVQNPDTVLARDVNGDAKDDLIIFDILTSSVYSFLSNGDGTFTVHPNPTVVAVSVSEKFTLADLNGDSKLDLVSETEGFAQVFLGNGDGSFSPKRDYFLLTKQSHNVVVADFNNDQKPDIAVGYMLVGKGDGTFQAPQGIAGSGGSATGDFNGDGISDLAVLVANPPGSPTLEIYLGSPTGVLSLAHAYNFAGIGCCNLLVGDVNGDGKLDLVTAGAVLLGNGDGSFENPVASPSCAYSEPISLGDFNGDHKLDLAFVVTNGPSSSLSVCLGNGDGSFGAPMSFFAGTNTNSLALADFNHDGNLDLAVGSDSGLAMLLGKGDGTFQQANFVVQTQTMIGTPADYNGDGNIDLIGTAGVPGPGVVYLGNGDGTFKTLSQPNVSLPAVAADFNGDGKLDLLTSPVPASDTLAIVLGHGDGTFATPIGIGTCWGYGCSLSGGVVGDFNGDKLPDIASGLVVQNVNQSAGTAILLNTTSAASGSQIGLVVPQGGSGSQTVTAGSTATYALSIGGMGWSGQVSLACSGAPAAATCSFPGGTTVNVSGSSASQFNVTVSTTARSMAALTPHHASPALWSWAVALGIAVLPLSTRRKRPILRFTRLLPLLVLSLVLITSCGGSTSTGTTGGSGTPAGNYTLTVTATAGTLNASVPLTLTVQ